MNEMNTPTTVAQVAAAIAQSISYATKIPLGREALLGIEQIISNYCQSQQVSGGQLGTMNSKDWDSSGNYIGRQPPYGFDAHGASVPQDEGWRVLTEGEVIAFGDQAFDIYAGWIATDNYHAKNKHHADSKGRWTAWRRKAPQPLPVSGENEIIRHAAYRISLLPTYHRLHGDVIQVIDNKETHKDIIRDAINEAVATERAARELEIPTITNRTKNIARERLGEVLRHSDGPNSASHGCVEVTKAVSEIEYWIARAELAEARAGDVTERAKHCALEIRRLNNAGGGVNQLGQTELTNIILRYFDALASVPAERTDVNQDTKRTGGGVVEYDGAFFCTLCGANWGAISHPDKPCEHSGERKHDQK